MSRTTDTAESDPLAGILISRDDVLEAARYRLRNWPPSRIDAALEAVDEAQSHQNGLQGIFSELAIPDDRQEPVGAICAILALLANAREDWALLYRAGHEVLRVYRQSRRATTCPRGGDALDDLILDHVRAMPEVEPMTLWRDFTREAADGDSDILIDFDEDAGFLTFARSLRGEQKDIGCGAFRKRVQRARRLV